MTREKLFDELLKIVASDEQCFWQLETTAERYLEIEDDILIHSIGDEMVSRGWVTPANYSNYSVRLTFDGREMMLKYGSYSSFLRSEKVAQKKAQRRIITPDIIKIGTAIIFGISAAILGWLNYLDNQTINEQKQEIKELKKQIEILKKK